MLTPSNYLAYGGRNRVLFMDGTTPAAVNSVLTGGTFNFQDSENVKGNPALKKLTVEIANKVINEDTDTFFSTYLTLYNAETAEFIATDGSKAIFGLDATDTNIKKSVCVHVGPKVGGKNRFTAFLGVLSGDTGDVNGIKDKSLAEVPVTATAIEAPANYVIVGACLFALLSDVIAAGSLTDITIPINSYGVIVWQ